MAFAHTHTNAKEMRLALLKLTRGAYESGETVCQLSVTIILNKQFRAYLKLARAKQRRQLAERASDAEL